MHARPALGAFVADDDDVPGFNVTPLYGLERGRLLVENPGRALELSLLVPSNLDHRALRGQVASEDGQSAGGAARRFDRVYHWLFVYRFGALHVFPQGLAGHGHGVAV